ncbi:Fic family protein [Microbacterium amylolyticum]|nr:Fic family protein [Microbacterium amylolyticum]
MQADRETEFAKPRNGEIEQRVAEVQEFTRDTPWKDLDRRRFIMSAATVFAYLNQAHPFRDGNGRTIRSFVTQIAEQTPFKVDFSRVSAEELYAASAKSTPRGERTWIDPRPLVGVIDAATVTRPDHAAGDRDTSGIRRRPADPNTGPVTPGSSRTGLAGPNL